MNIPLFNPSCFKRILLITSAFLAVQAGAADPVTIGDYSGPAATETNGPADTVANSVVKIFSAVRYPDFLKPWAKQASTEVTGSGVIIEGRRILTCAHVVMYASQIQVQANQSGDKLPGKVEAIAPGIDLAVIKLDDESFFDTHPPLAESRKLPQNRDMVMAYGYPLGGTSLSITKGIVSRIEFTPYSYPVSGLRVQVDAAINPGNSGGPAVVDDKMIGLAFSRLGGPAENVGYIIPCEEIDLFLQGLASGHYDGKPIFFDYCQALNAPLRSFLKLTNSVQGVVLNKIADPTPDYPLKKWDVITKIGDASVDDLGMVSLGNGLRVFFK
jgi:S1-C subfamily serine protease